MSLDGTLEKVFYVAYGVEEPQVHAKRYTYIDGKSKEVIDTIKTNKLSALVFNVLHNDNCLELDDIINNNIYNDDVIDYDDLVKIRDDINVFLADPSEDTLTDMGYIYYGNKSINDLINIFTEANKSLEAEIDDEENEKFEYRYRRDC